MTRFFESKFFEAISKLADLVLLSLYFVVCSIPIFTMGASLTALYYSVHKVLFKGRGYTTEFFHSFKDNFKQATLSWLIFLLVGGLLSADIYIMRNYFAASTGLMGSMWVVFVVLLVLLILWALYHFTYMARFANGFKDTFKISGVLTIVHIGWSLVIGLIALVVVYLVYRMPLLYLLAPAILLSCVHPIFEKIYRKYMSEEDLAKEDAR